MAVLSGQQVFYLQRSEGGQDGGHLYSQPGLHEQRGQVSPEGTAGRGELRVYQGCNKENMNTIIIY